jgi:cytochrome c oxidase subunit III
MMSSRTPTLERARPPRTPDAGGWDGGGWESSGGRAAAPVGATQIAAWLLVGAITVLFAAFTSTYLVRRSQADWQAGPLPPLLWTTTALIVASSGTLEWTKRRGRQGALSGLRRGLAATSALGLAFLIGQVTAWRQLVAAGVYLAGTPHSAFFYLLTGAHAVHLVGGIGALGYALWKVRGNVTPAEALDVAEPVATYWHFLTGLWVYLFIILFAL